MLLLSFPEKFLKVKETSFKKFPCGCRAEPCERQSLRKEPCKA